MCGYRILEKPVKSCPEALFYVGFPASSLSKAADAVRARGGEWEESGDDLAIISGVNMEYDPQALAAAASQRPGKVRTGQRRKAASLERRIASFDLTASTPLECMNFIAVLQNELRRLA